MAVETVDGAQWCFSQAIYVNLLDIQIQKHLWIKLNLNLQKPDCPAKVENTVIPKYPDNKMNMY